MRIRRRRWCVLSAVLVVSPSWATHGLVLSDFEPADAGSTWFSLQSKWTTPQAVSVGTVIDQGIHPVTVYDAQNDTVVDFVDHQLFGRLVVGALFAEHFAFNLSLPVLLSTAGNSIEVEDQPHVAPSGMGIGDVRVELDVRLPPLGNSVDSYLGVRAWLPTGDPKQFTSTGAVRLAPQAGFAGTTSILSYAGRVAVETHMRNAQFANQEWGHRLQLAGALGFELYDRRLTIGPEVFASTVLGDNFLAGPVTRCEVLIGAHYRAFEHWLVGFGSGFGATRGIGTPDIRLLGMLSFNLHGTHEPAAPTASPSDVPPPRAVRPQAPLAPQPKLPLPPPDHDRDAISDADDACPEAYGPASSERKYNGCPLPQDRDRDRVPDAEDACIALPGLASETPNLNGCPLPVSDNDGDGINDASDACPQRPGPTNIEPALHGCPTAELVGSKIQILGRVEFEPRLSQLTPESEPVLLSVLQILQSHTVIKRLRIEGHTDNHGSVQHNLGLSLSRAQAVVAWLVNKGIDPARLVAKGWGSQKPIDTNESEDGRRNNRRVEFRVLEFAD